MSYYVGPLLEALHREYGAGALPERVQAAVDGVNREFLRLNNEAAALRVEADRREKRAFDMAHDCEWHGAELASLESAVLRFWRDNQHLDGIRWGMVTQLILLASEPDHPAEPRRDHLPVEWQRFEKRLDEQLGRTGENLSVEMTVDELRRRIRAIVDQQRKSLDGLHKKDPQGGCPRCAHCRDADGTKPARGAPKPKPAPARPPTGADRDLVLFDARETS